MGNEDSQKNAHEILSPVIHRPSFRKGGTMIRQLSKDSDAIQCLIRNDHNSEADSGADDCLRHAKCERVRLYLFPQPRWMGIRSLRFIGLKTSTVLNRSMFIGSPCTMPPTAAKLGARHGARSPARTWARTYQDPQVGSPSSKARDTGLLGCLYGLQELGPSAARAFQIHPVGFALLRSGLGW